MQTKIFPRFSEHIEAVTVKRCSVKKSFLKNFTNFTRLHLCWSLFLTKLQAFRPATLLKTDSNTAVKFLWATAFKHRSSFLEVLCRSCCSALINAVMKYSFSAAVVQSLRVLHGNLLKIAFPHRYFSKYFTTVAEQQYSKLYLDGCFWGWIYFGNIPA